MGTAGYSKATTQGWLGAWLTGKKGPFAATSGAVGVGTVVSLQAQVAPGKNTTLFHDAMDRLLGVRNGVGVGVVYDNDGRPWEVAYGPARVWVQLKDHGNGPTVEAGDVRLYSFKPMPPIERA